ncbi:MAG: DUF4214 domain-containing protein [Acidimicrobiales bacterium]
MANNKRVGGLVAAAFMISTAVVAATPSAATSAAQQTGSATAKPIIYLSFDDGPSLDGETTHLMNVLDAYDVDATFFIVGDKLASATNQTALRRMYADGHAVGNHSWNHLPLDTLSDAELINTQLRQTHERVKAVSGYDMRCFRAPWGKSRITKNQVTIIEDFGYQVENAWQIDASEYVFTEALPGGPAVADQIAAKLATATHGNRILLHDGVLDRSAMVAGVEQFLAAHRNDYEFRTIPGCENDTTTPPPAGPSYDGPIANAATVGEILAASDYTAGDADYLRLYHALLAREPDVAGAKYWLAQSRVGSTLDDVAWGFSQSSEFVKKYGNLDDAAFVTTVYGNVLGRTPDTAGRNYWLGEVTSGRLSRHGVVRWIAESNEFKAAHPYAPT